MQPCHVPGEGVSFTTAPLRKPLEVTGNPVTHIRIAADRPDANLFAYLEDVSADGSAYVVTEGRLKASLRATAEAPFQVPGTPGIEAFNRTRARCRRVRSSIWTSIFCPLHMNSRQLIGSN